MLKCVLTAGVLLTVTEFTIGSVILKKSVLLNPQRNYNGLESMQSSIKIEEQGMNYHSTPFRSRVANIIGSSSSGEPIEYSDDKASKQKIEKLNCRSYTDDNTSFQFDSESSWDSSSESSSSSSESSFSGESTESSEDESPKRKVRKLMNPPRQSRIIPVDTSSLYDSESSKDETLARESPSVTADTSLSDFNSSEYSSDSSNSSEHELLINKLRRLRTAQERILTEETEKKEQKRKKQDPKTRRSRGSKVRVGSHNPNPMMRNMRDDYEYHMGLIKDFLKGAENKVSESTRERTIQFLTEIALRVGRFKKEDLDKTWKEFRNDYQKRTGKIFPTVTNIESAPMKWNQDRLMQHINRVGWDTFFAK